MCHHQSHFRFLQCTLLLVGPFAGRIVEKVGFRLPMLVAGVLCERLLFLICHFFFFFFEFSKKIHKSSFYLQNQIVFCYLLLRMLLLLGNCIFYLD